MFTGIDIGGTKCAVITGDENGIKEKIRFASGGVNKTLENITAAVQKLGVGKAIGISCGGPLDSKKGIIMSPPNLPGWDNIKIVRLLEERFGVPAGIQNDANACALAEWKYGAGKGSKNMIFLTFGTGMGAGLILDGRLYTGANDMAGEIGLIRMDTYGPVGYGKAGSFEGFCSGGGIAEIGKTVARESLQCGKSTAFCRNYDELGKITAKKIAAKRLLSGAGKPQTERGTGRRKRAKWFVFLAGRKDLIRGGKPGDTEPLNSGVGCGRQYAEK